MSGKVWILFFLVSVSCAPSDGPHKPVVKKIGNQSGSRETNVQVLTSGEIDYFTVRPIFVKNCAACHPDSSKPDWLDYSQAEPFIKNGLLNRRVVIEKSMPPPGSPQANTITEKERDTIEKWLLAGGPKSIVASSPDSTTSPLPTTSPPGESVRTNGSNQSAKQFGEITSLVRSCTGCHGSSVRQDSADTYIPTLNGQSADYLKEQLVKYKWLDRIDPSYNMNRIVASLDEDTIVELADYFSNIESETSKASAVKAAASANGKAASPAGGVEASALFNRGAKIAENACNSCHSNPSFNNLPITSVIPILSGQPKQYIVNQLLYFQKKMRRDQLMENVVEGLSHEDILAVAEYFSIK